MTARVMMWLLALSSNLAPVPDIETTLKELRSADPAARIAAIRCLAKSPTDTRISEPLFTALDDASPKVRAEAARIWGIVAERLDRAIQKERPNGTSEGSSERWQAWQRRLVDSLAKSATDPDSNVAFEALRSLAMIGESVEDKVPYYPMTCGTGMELRLDFKSDDGFDKVAQGRDSFLFEFLNDTNPQVVFRGISGLANSHREQLKPYLVRFLNDSRWQLRGVSASHLARLLREDATNLIAPLFADSNSRVRTTVIRSVRNPDRVLAALAPGFAFDSIPMKRSILELIETLKAPGYRNAIYFGALDSDAQVREEALSDAVLTNSILPEAVLAMNCQHRDPKVRKAAATAFAHQSGNQAADTLVRMLIDSDQTVREEALYLLCKLSNPSLLGPMLAAYRRSNDEFDPGIGEVIRQEGAALAPLVRRLLKDRDDRFRVLGLECSVDTLEGHAAVAAAKRALKDNSVRVRGHAVEILGDSGSPQNLALLEPFLKDPERDIRWCALTAIGNLPDPKAPTLISSFLTDPDEHIAFVAKYALEHQQSREVGIPRGQFAPKQTADVTERVTP